MVKSLVSKLSSASSTLSIASSFGSSHGKHHHDNTAASSTASTAISGDNYLKYRNDPGRFFGDGVQFKAKLIGILEVGEARGDRMCQEALQDLKMAIRAAGEHKQRITIHVTIDGLRLRDEKTGDSLYHHPVHKISFIAQDMTDSRAFGYIFGSPDSGHRFFGIKTDKAASQVVLAMRDLFQVVFELKKKEIELARQQIQSKSLHHHDGQHQLSSLSSLKSAAAAGTAGQNDLSGLGGSTTSAATLSMLNTMVSSSTNTPNTSRLGVNLDSKGASKEISPESVADLVDLEQELSSLQRGITQMERITPNDAHSQQTSTLTSNAAKATTTLVGSGAGGVGGGGGGGSDDPFGDSFTSFPTLPPPEPGRLRSKTTTKPNDITITNIPTTTAGLNTATVNLQPLDDDDDNWLRELDAHSDVFDTSKTVVPGLMGMPPLASSLTTAVPLPSRAPLAARESSDTPPNHIYETVSCSANPMPADMAELSSISNNATNNADTNTNNLANSSSLSDIFQTAAAESAQNSKLDIKSEPVAVPAAATGDPVMLPRDTDPFSPTRKKSDPFEEGGDLFSKLDPFEFEFTNSGIGEVDITRKAATSLSPSTVDQLTGSGAQVSQDLLAGHLQVNLPPEGDSAQPISTVRSRPVPSAMSAVTSGVGIAPASGATLPPTSMLKQQTVDVISSISNKKMPHLFGQSSRFSKRDSNSINMRRLQESDSLSETETAPEPPPRPDYAICVEPPPLPPKKQFNDFVIRSRNGPSHSLSSTVNQSMAGNRYDSLNSVLASKSQTGRSANTDVPPIPLPSRRVGRTDGSYPGPGRPRKPGHTEDDYLAPISLIGSGTGSSITNASIMSDVPPLLPPPTQTSSRARTQRQQSLNQQSKAHDIYENKSEILQQIQQQQQQQQQQQKQTILEHHSPAPGAIHTLTQLLTLGIDELAVKLNVPTSKLSTMTLVELTSYLSEFLEQNKPTKVEYKVETSQENTQQHSAPIFKVNFDQEATFVAKFDDTFGEDFHQHSSAGTSTSFEANFAQFDTVSVEPPGQDNTQNANLVPSADRYAVFREIIDQELQQQQESVDLIGDVMETEIPHATDEEPFEATTITDLDMNVTHQTDLLSGDMMEVPGPQPPKIDTKISEVLAQAKDRYAALRDLILVENLFDKPAPKPPSITTDMETLGHNDNKSPFQGFSGFNDDEEDQDLRQLMDQASTLDAVTQQQRLGLVDSRGFLVEPSSSAITVEEDEDEEEEEERRNNGREDTGGLSSADSNEKEQDKDTMPTTQYEQLASSNQQLEEIEEKPEIFNDNPQISITQSQMPTNSDSKYLSVVSVASSGLSGSKDDLEIDDLMHRAISNLSLDSRERNSPAIAPQQQNTHSTTTTMTPPHFNDVSTSPIPLQRSPLPSLTSQQNKSPNNKSPQQVSPLPSQLTVVSQIIDAATKQIQSDAISKTSNDSWATFDTPQHQPVIASDKRARPAAKLVAKANNFLNLPPPPGSISNCSQNDSAIESPCSSDPREEAWHKHTMGGSSLSLGHQAAPLGGSTSAQRRYHKKERQNTSSSSRDLSWDEDQGSIPPTHVLDYPPPSKRLSGQLQGSLTTDRHGYYRRHARRMNSCDDEYDYEQDYTTSRRDREQCKYKHSLSRSRDNFEMDSPGWYHHHGPQHPHHTWSSQDIEQARGRNFERSAYERTTYGPPIYDKRGVGPPLPPTSSYDRRSAGGGVYDKRGKYYRGDSNPRSAERIYNLDDFDEMLAASGKIPAHLASMYEEMKAECCSPPLPTHRQQRTSDYMYERDRKSFDRESLESYEGSNVVQRRRRRSYDSGGIPSDPYGSCDSRDEYHGRERCVMTADKSRSLRKSLKSLRVTGDIDYDQDSEKEYHYRDQRSRCDTRSLQRPSQLTTQGVGGVVVGAGGSVLGSQSRIRKSSGSSPWDGEEPPLPGQKTTPSSWKRPSSAAEAERRRAAVKGQTPSGSDEDKDRRYRKKRTTRNKDLPGIPSNAGRYGRSGNYDYISCEDLDDDAEDYVDEEEEEEEDRGIEHDEISPADEDKFARLEMRRHEMHNRMMDAHVRRRKEVPPPAQPQVSSMAYRKGGKGGYIRRPLPPPTEPKHPQDYGFDDDDGDDGEYEQTPTPRSNTSSALPTATPNASTKFSFDVGFESDFNQSSPPPAPAGTASSCNSTPAANVSAANTPASKSSFRFSNDFSAGQDREKHFQHPPAGSLQQYDLENRGISPQTSQTQTSTPKLRFDDNVKVSQFDDAFEDDFSKATFDAFQNDDVQWQESIQKTTKQQIRNNKLQQRQQDLIKKSESVNIFAKKVEDPFEDDEFFNSPPSTIQLTANTAAAAAANDKTENHKTNGNGGSGGSNNGGGGGNAGSTAGWDDDNTNFAKFDENM
ncbi:protein disabled isoform X2 [Calliphora vicina]|uniref:protein disabled isoform X2 n=1 Tax=Calliphora vicina TaxID=7373 RepID=UPI00325B7331